ncbi:prolyl oligopeptidase family serine peptidase [Metallibacterium sp.]|uniref:prolyl oligopeptidase family serine peptidase n=1 Tax=Metallibacterium sp. TaxID=2940281 RepID=UPI00263518C7|nr:prolyl oligopeptidase family serine peptidase [Metallibacterium sp.]
MPAHPRRHALALAVLAAMIAMPALAAAPLHYPVARRDRIVNNYFGDKVPAPYQWMENLNDPALKVWVEKENALTHAYLAKVPTRPWIEQRLTRLWNYAKEGVPVQAGKYLFFSRNSGLQNQSPVYVQAGASGKPRELLDPNTLSPNGDIALLDWQPSQDGHYLAYGLSQGGSDWETLHVMDVATGKTLSDDVQWVKFSGIAWTHDGKGFFYSRYPAPPKGEAISDRVENQALYYHRLGTPQSDDVLIYKRPDLPEWIIGGQVSHDGKYLFISLVNGTANRNELFVKDLGTGAQPDLSAPIRPLFTSNDAVYQPIGTIGDTVYLQTTLDAPRGRIVAFNIGHPDVAHWRVVVPQTAAVIQSASLADGRVLVNKLKDVKSELELYASDGKHLATLPLPTLGSVGGISSHEDSKQVYYAFTSFLYPTTIFNYDVSDGKTSTVFKPDVPFDPSNYETVQVFYHSKDGTRVPMFLTYRKGLKRDGLNPTLLYAYGGFDISITPSFSPTLPVWLELGGIYAVANIRGGGEYGEAWHKAGMLGNKQNVFDDFAWAAKWLVKNRYTEVRRLGIQGYSNGGLLIGASITERPRLFGAAYAGAGVMDMLRYQKFSGGALWAPEYGTADVKKDFEWLIKYSPVQNVRPGTCYPPTIITTADHDDRVVPSNSYKFTAAMQHDQACANPILLRVETDTSHNYMPTDKRIRQSADILAFMANNLGVSAAPKGNPDAPGGK